MANSSFAVDDAKLREELEKFDVNVGKITSKNREILVKKLNHLRARQRPKHRRLRTGRRAGGRLVAAAGKGRRRAEARRRRRLSTSPVRTTTTTRRRPA